MRTTFIPSELHAEAQSLFGTAELPAYGQLATVGPHGPEVRTVHFRMEPSLGTLVFNSHNASRKVHSLTAATGGSACLFDESNSMQWQWQFKAYVVADTADSSVPQPFEDIDLAHIRTTQWAMVRADVRSTYWHEYLAMRPEDSIQKHFDVNLTPTPFVTVICLCNAWTIFRVDPENYSRSIRTRYTRLGGEWSAQRMNLLFSE